MVAEHRCETMAMNTFMDAISEFETMINVQDPTSSKIHDLFNMINVGSQVFHKQVTDINDKLNASDVPQKINNLDQMMQQINANLHALAGQVAQHQAAPGPQQPQHKKSILEFKVIQNIKPLTGDKGHFRKWHQKLINALSTIREEHAEIIRTIERSMDIGETIDEALDDLDQQFHLDDFNKDLLCILTDKCDGEAYDKIKGLQNKKGA